MDIRLPRLKTLAATLTAAALAFGTVATPVQAENRDREMLTILGGLAAAGILLNQTQNSRGGVTVYQADRGYGYQGRNYGYQAEQPRFRRGYDDPRYYRYGAPPAYGYDQPRGNGWGYDRGYARGHDRRDDWRHDQRRDLRSDNGRQLIPSRCIGTGRVGGRMANVVNEDCYRGVSGRGFPNDCAVDVRTRHGKKEAYGLNCLGRLGYDTRR
ncbi:hypothetical protein V8J36_18095 [Frigidibacter sp. MR17.14]|uniref:hypothetical protein n=1 Tax=Frigidibacter sp. MR17.14 TaxID=3126509 RepID=UPI003012B5E3